MREPKPKTTLDAQKGGMRDGTAGCCDQTLEAISNSNNNPNGRNERTKAKVNT